MGQQEGDRLRRVAQAWSWSRWLSGDKTSEEIRFRLDRSGLPLEIRRNLGSLIQQEDSETIRSRVYEIFGVKQIQKPVATNPELRDEKVPETRKERKRMRKARKR